MKIVLLLLSLLLVSVYTQDTSLVLDSQFDVFEENVESIQDKIKAAKCIAGGAEQVKQTVDLAKKILSGNVFGSIKDIVQLTKRLFTLLDNCSVLFCFGPTYERCENDHPQGCEKWGLIIYPKCKQGYTNWECCVCANECPSGFRDDGLYCAKPAAYGRGAGYALWDKQKCFDRHSQGCEKNGALWYPKCREGFHNVGCCICSPNCPSGWTDIGVSCKKPSSYGRGVGYAVSFGLKCLNQKKKLTLADNCAQQKEILQELTDAVSYQLDKTLENGNDYQSYFPDHVKDLGELLQQYSEQCLEQQEQIAYN
ncbi:hypothetical protein PPERSA_11467 [Pseudocohnilembus persalinus]|uniref:Insulin-like growth factor binding protein, N-terminal n=1 Tax=Pseudocohnilembus persalinus TaxID=266149 RepID=A0A0V0QX94_PSEPJ|nr:hypothetical protein PPERSA_11467 [Pseudocohnilembus persalinus]|eukprot:KRX06822.1 hypothetical protein PPERSA_11467 [Pseudocohnilembus persalinus]